MRGKSLVVLQENQFKDAGAVMLASALRHSPTVDLLATQCFFSRVVAILAVSKYDTFFVSLIAVQF